MLHARVTDLPALPYVDLGASGIVVLVVLFVLTNKLIWHTRLRDTENDWRARLQRAETDRDKWQDVALRALGVADKMTTQGEVTTAIVASLPDPGTEEAP